MRGAWFQLWSLLIVLVQPVLFGQPTNLDRPASERERTFHLTYKAPASEYVVGDEAEFFAAHRNAWERVVLAIRPEEISSGVAGDLSVVTLHTHCGVTIPGAFGMEWGQRDAETLRLRLREMVRSERDRLVAELKLLQAQLRSKKRAPLPYCEAHDYATPADRLEAMHAAGIRED